MILYTKSLFGCHFRSECMYKKLRNFRGRHLVSHLYGEPKTKVMIEECEILSGMTAQIKKTTGGGHNGPPPQVS